MNEVQKIVLAVDLGTTSTRTLAVSGQGEVLASHSVRYPLYTPKPGYAEQDPKQIYEACVTTIAAVMEQGDWQADDVLCVTFSSANHSLIAIDEAGQPLTPSITWADQRSAEQAKAMLEHGIGLDIYKRTGTPIHPMSPLVKLVWLKEKEPQLFAEAHQFIGIKEYIFLQLFGTPWMDYSIASATGMFNLEKLEWDKEAVDWLGLNMAQLPPLVPTTFKVTGLKEEIAEQMHLSTTTPFVLGAQDGVLANLGIGALEDGVVAVTIGTSSAVRACTNKPTFDEEGRLFCYALTEGYWLVGGSSNNGAIVAEWAAEQWFNGESLSEILPRLSEISPGADGLLFMPLLSGERAPFWDAEAKGVMFGLTLAHTKQHMMRAALEGVLFQLLAIVSMMEEKGTVAKQIRASGGFARSPLWCQMMADMLGVAVFVPDVVESSGLGAAQLGIYAMNNEQGKLCIWDNMSGTTYEPDSNNHRIYRQLLPTYLQLYYSLKDAMSHMTVLQQTTLSV
ncbi:gluconokinase [Paenibacillus yanchengensis]|uniref:Gluconokinase n=1 Tax=Paenibacillus yanchengensis TaxID=2035833 RepID=A0ABW4YGR5_9BACL